MLIQIQVAPALMPKLWHQLDLKIQHLYYGQVHGIQVFLEPC